MSKQLPEAAGNTLSDKQLETVRAGVAIMVRKRLRGDPGAEDALQEVMSRVLEAIRLGKVQDESRLGAFAAGVARHVISDTIQRNVRERSRDRVAPDSLVSRDADPLSRVITEAEYARVRDAMDALSRRDRDVLRWSYFEDQTPAEIAKRTGEPVPRIRKRKSRALERIRTALQGRHDRAAGETTSGGTDGTS